MSKVVNVVTDNDYQQLEGQVAELISINQDQLFMTNVHNLFDTYLSNIPESSRQHYNCNCCKRFIENYGGLVTISPISGEKIPLLWKLSPNRFFEEATVSMNRRVSFAKINGVFYSGDITWGRPTTGEWTHLHGHNPKVYSDALLSDYQKMAEKREEYVMLQRAMTEFPIEAVKQAVRVLNADALTQSEIATNIANWFLKLLELPKPKNDSRSNLIWLAVAQAPAGWCHIKTTMLGTLLSDIVAGLDFESIKHKWSQKVHPLEYRRPTTISEGNIEQANQAFEKLNLTEALKRRFADLSDVQKFIWQPKDYQITSNQGELKGGAFDHLIKKETIADLKLPTTTITWQRFCETVLPSAYKIELKLPNGRHGFYGLVTGPAEPKLLQWDNPVTWYFHNGGSYAPDWNIKNSYTEVTGIFLKPCHWTQEYPQQEVDVLFSLKDCYDVEHKAGGCFFPSMIRSDLHSISKVIEQYAKGYKIEGQGTANGIAINNSKNGIVIRVNGDLCYHIDRLF